ncbi:hypothetical protein NPIL_440971 [Nephila pilipes]|uniref:Uncharacterized protein n=1 Tax=Nephila pilipes TaxID=299642 RepID=A0A8X6P4B2_NEPPI|nr:hypothetical protein NPIL_440971 [Nephila pilipes]
MNVQLNIDQRSSLSYKNKLTNGKTKHQIRCWVTGHSNTVHCHWGTLRNFSFFPPGFGVDLRDSLFEVIRRTFSRIVDQNYSGIKNIKKITANIEGKRSGRSPVGYVSAHPSGMLL